MPDNDAMLREDVEKFIAEPTLPLGNNILRQLRARLDVPGPDAFEVDVRSHEHVTNTRLAEVLLSSRDFCPTACHWSLNTAAGRLKALDNQPPPNPEECSLHPVPGRSHVYSEREDLGCIWCGQSKPVPA